MITRNRFVLAALLALTLLLSACGDSGTGDTESETASEPAPSEATVTEPPAEETEETASVETVTEGVLTVCTDSPYPPMEFEKDGEFTGFDIELMRAIGEELGLTVEVNNTGFDPITSGTALESDQCDIAAASITITPEREKAIGFTDPYFDAEQSLLVKKDSGITSLADLADKRIAVQSGTTGKKYAEENDPGAADIVSFDNPGDLFVALEAGDVDAILQDLVVNGPRATKDDTLEVVETYSTDEQYGLAVAKDNTAMLDAVNEALQTLRDDGTYDELHQEWFAGA